MSLLCLIKHKWITVEAFHTNLVNEAGEITGSRESWTGYECVRCDERKIKKNTCVAQSAGATQSAYDWLNEKRKELKGLSI